MQQPALILVSGPPGCGKSTLARVISGELHCLWLDKDCIDEPFSPGDRGSHYTREVEPKVILGLLNLARLNLEVRKNILLDLPWTHILLNAPEWKGKIENLAKETGAKLLVLECHLPEKVLRERLEKRGLERDKVKLTREGWKNFSRHDRILEKNPLPHFLISVEEPVEECKRKALKYLLGEGIS